MDRPLLCAQVYPHIDHGAGGNNWWNTVPGGWEMDTLQAMRYFHEQAKKAGRRSIQIDFGACFSKAAAARCSTASRFGFTTTTTTTTKNA